MKWILLLGFVSALAFSQTACFYDVEEELYPTLGCDTAEVSYQADIVPIIAANCLDGCHSQAVQSGAVVLEAYPDVEQWATNGILVNVVKHTPGFSQMPKNRAKLIDCDIAKIEKWVLEGALNN